MKAKIVYGAGFQISKHAITHGMTHHPAFRSWQKAKNRCLNPRHDKFPRYGGRGIKMCQRWLDSFENFWEDMGLTWALGLELDRENNDGDYCKENCRWVTHIVNCNNRPQAKKLTYLGVTKTVTEWSLQFGMKRRLILERISYGWTPERILTEPRRVWATAR
jgi:hypothetical protein